VRRPGHRPPKSWPHVRRRPGTSEPPPAPTEQATSNVPSSTRRPAEMRGAGVQITADHGTRCNPGVEIAERTGYTVVQVSRLRRRFAEYGVVGLHDRARSGRRPTVAPRTGAQFGVPPRP